MEQKSVIQTPAAPAAIGPYSQAIACGNLLFCSGQIPLDPATMQLAGESAADQAVQALENLKAVLIAGGSSLAAVVKTTIFLADMADFTAVNEVYARYFPAPAPARSTVQVAALPRGAKVEIEAIAIRG